MFPSSTAAAFDDSNPRRELSVAVADALVCSLEFRENLDVWWRVVDGGGEEGSGSESKQARKQASKQSLLSSPIHPKYEDLFLLAADAAALCMLLCFCYAAAMLLLLLLLLLRCCYLPRPAAAQCIVYSV